MLYHHQVGNKKNVFVEGDTAFKTHFFAVQNIFLRPNAKKILIKSKVFFVDVSS